MILIVIGVFLPRPYDLTPPDNDEVMDFAHNPSNHNVIYFDNEEYKGVDLNHNEAFVNTIEVANHDVQKTLIDNGSSLDIIFLHALKRMNVKPYKLEPSVITLWVWTQCSAS